MYRAAFHRSAQGNARPADAVVRIPLEYTRPNIKSRLGVKTAPSDSGDYTEKWSANRD